MRRASQELLLVLVTGLVLATIWTWPLVPNLGRALPFDPASAGPLGSDMHIWTWNFWWAGEVVRGAGAPFFSDAIYLPLGQSLVFHTHTFFYGLVTLPLQWAFGVPFAVGAAILLLLATAFTATYALGRELGLGRTGALLAGFAWAFAPYFLQKSLEHLCFVASPWPPLLALLLLRWMTSPPWGAWRPALGAGLVVGLGLLSGSLTGLYLVLFGLAVALLAPPLLAPRPGDRTLPTTRRLRLLDAGPLLLFLVAALVAAWPLLVELRAEAGALVGSPTHAGALARDVALRPELGDFLRLSSMHPLAPTGVEHPPGWNEVSALHISGVLVVLAALALAAGRRLLPWLGLSIGFLLLTWDPVIASADGGFFSALYHRLPLLDALRVPARFFPLALLPLCLLAGLGFERLRARSLPGALLLALLLVAEQWVGGFPLMSVEPPPAVASLAATSPRSGGGDGVLTLPAQMGASSAMTWQAIHGRPVVFSYVARPNPRTASFWMQATPDLFSLAVPRLGPHGDVELPDPLALSLDLEGLGVGDVLVDEAVLAQAGPALVQGLADLLDAMPGWERQDVPGSVSWWRRVA